MLVIYLFVYKCTISVHNINNIKEYPFWLVSCWLNPSMLTLFSFLIQIFKKVKMATIIEVIKPHVKDIAIFSSKHGHVHPNFMMFRDFFAISSMKKWNLSKYCFFRFYNLDLSPSKKQGLSIPFWHHIDSRVNYLDLKVLHGVWIRMASKTKT